MNLWFPALPSSVRARFLRKMTTILYSDFRSFPVLFLEVEFQIRKPEVWQHFRRHFRRRQMFRRRLFLSNMYFYYLLQLVHLHKASSPRANIRVHLLDSDSPSPPFDEASDAALPTRSVGGDFRGQLYKTLIFHLLKDLILILILIVLILILVIIVIADDSI